MGQACSGWRHHSQQRRFRPPSPIDLGQREIIKMHVAFISNDGSAEFFAFNFFPPSF
jgi:hypothetical protein